jgi:hypothetical protein
MKIFTKYKDSTFYLKRITTEKEMRENPQAIELLNRLATESEIDLQKRLSPRGFSLRTLHKPSELWQVSEGWLKSSFETEANRTVFVVEDEKGKVAHCTILTINDPEVRKKNRVSDSVGTYIYITHAVTQEEYKGCGLFSKVFDKINTMFLNPKRDLPLPIHYTISVSNAPVVRLSDEEEFDFVMNLPTYAGMWQKRLFDNQVQVRFQDLETGVQEGRERLPLSNFLISKNFDEIKMSDFVKEKRPEAKVEGKFVRGMFLEGRETKTYAQRVEYRKSNNLVQLTK